jgi:uncharacterized protein (DUF305 family)
MSRLIRSATLVVAGILITACGGGDSTGADAESFNASDVMFAQMMIPHHEQAIEMSDIALDPTTGAGDTVRELATAIKAAQDPEIAEMTALLGGWGMSTEMDPSMDHSDMMSGMLTLDELDELAGLRGDAFDRAWLEAMIRHHEGAIDMAEDVLADGADPAMRSLAERIIDAQRAEIDRMRALLGA